MYKLKKSSEVSMREAFEDHFKRSPAEFLERIKVQQVAVAVMCGDGFIARQHAEQPAIAYVDSRVGGLPYSTGSIASATACLILMAEVAGLDPNHLPPYTSPVGLDTNDGYKNEAEETAVDIIKEMLDGIVDDTLELGEVNRWPIDDIPGFDRQFHETPMGDEYGLADAARVIDELSDYEEDDEGMWEGQQPEEAISTKAAFTFRNAVRHYIGEIFVRFREDEEISDILDSYNEPEDSPDYEIQKQAQRHALRVRIEQLLED